jgi:hypothetical protein
LSFSGLTLAIPVAHCILKFSNASTSRRAILHNPARNFDSFRYYPDTINTISTTYTQQCWVATDDRVISNR